MKFFLTGVANVATQATDTARKIVDLREAHRSLIAEKFGNHAGKAMRLLERLYRRPFTTVGDAKELLGISFSNASTLIDKFTDGKILVEMTGQSRYRVFLYAPYVVLFSDI